MADSFKLLGYKYRSLVSSFQLFYFWLAANHNFEINCKIPVCVCVGGWSNGSEGEEEREEVERALDGINVVKAWTFKPSAEAVPLWKLRGLREAEMGTQKAEHT